MKQIMILALLMFGCSDDPTPTQIAWCTQYGAAVNHATKWVGTSWSGACYVQCDDEWIPIRNYVGCPFRVKQ